MGDVLVGSRHPGMRVARRILVVGLSLGLVALMVSAAYGSAATGSGTVRIVTSNVGILNAPMYVAAAEGYFADEGVQVQISDGGGGSVAVAAIVGGSADMGVVGLGNVSHAVAKKQDIRGIAPVTNNLIFNLVVNKSDVQAAGITAQSSLHDKLAYLDGKALAVPDIGGSSGTFVRYMLSRAGFPDGSVKLISMPDSQAELASLRAGRIAGFVNASPVPEEAVAKGYGVTLINGLSFPDLAGMPYMVLAARSDYLQDHQQQTQAVLRALGRAESLIARQPQEAEKAFYSFLATQSSGGSLSPDVADLAWSSNVPNMGRSLVIDPAAVDRGREALGIPASAATGNLIDTRSATTVQNGAAGG